MKKLMITVAATIALFAGAAQAATTTAQAVTSVLVLSSGNVIFKLSGAALNPNSCPNSGYLLVDSPVKKEWLATLLTAKAGDIRVILNVADAVCEGNNPRITGITLAP